MHIRVNRSPIQLHLENVQITILGTIHPNNVIPTIQELVLTPDCPYDGPAIFEHPQSLQTTTNIHQIDAGSSTTSGNPGVLLVQYLSTYMHTTAR